MICHAGAFKSDDNTVPTKDTYVFDPEIQHFSQVEADPNMGARYFHRVAYVERPFPQTDVVFMYGGTAGIASSFGDSWMMDTGIPGNSLKNSFCIYIRRNVNPLTLLL